MPLNKETKHNLPLLFCRVLLILALIWLVFMAWFYAAIRRDSVSLLNFPFCTHIQVFSYELSPIIIIISLFTWNHKTVQSNYYQTEIATWNYIIVYKLLALDRKTWNYTTVCKLFVLDWNTWYQITVCKQIFKRITLKRNNNNNNL